MTHFIRRPHGGIHYDEETATGSAPNLSQNVSTRSIHINENQSQKFAANQVTTAKYTILTFLPKFLFEQFRRYANIFFLVIGLLQQIPDVSPTGRYVTLVPFTIILGLTAIKELIEDWKRHSADNRVNNTFAEVFNHSSNKFEAKKWKEISVGDIIKVINEKPFPADLILLSSSEPEGMCFIETANLDGETNLKIRTAIQNTVDKFMDEIDIANQRGVINCEPPNRMLYEFKGNIQLSDDDSQVPLPESTLLLRGAKLKNSEWINGIVVYSGPETKFMMNSTKAPLKRSTMDITTNVQIVYLFIILIVMSLMSAVGSEILSNNGQVHWYVSIDKTNFFFNLLTFIILYNNLIPISLLVTLEFVKFFQAYFINWDMEMYHEASDTYAAARTSNLNEELGQIKYVFSDKTGTLTQNVMVFKNASIAGIEFSADDVPFLHENLVKNDSKSERIRDFMIHLSVCHSVIPQPNHEDGTITYNASSPDEEALVKGAALFGFRFIARTQEAVQVSMPSETSWFKIREMIAFTSKRKRMSVIVESKEGFRVYIKGADNIILNRLEEGGKSGPYFQQTVDHIKMFAEKGLRTLCLAVRDLTEEQYYQWQTEYTRAKSDVTSNRDDLMETVADKIEKDLRLLGATGIEDKLQDGVPQTIHSLLQADIHVWMLTGDKQETAINIGRSCNLLKSDNRMVIIDSDTLDKTRDIISENLTLARNPNNNFTGLSPANEIVVDGDSLAFALDHSLRNDFIELCCSCSSVICCRVSPMQKAEMVELVQKYTKSICLSIGDGANDVAMIQKANVGVGISGNEGLQAANSSDFSVAQFRFLSRLLFVHGAWFNARNSKVILYSFYKNICLYIIELWFAIYSYWTGQVLFERWTIGLYNMLMTSLPPIAIGLFDQTCKAETRMEHPQLYKASQNSEFFNLKVFWLWIADAIVHSVVLYWLPMLAYSEGVVWSSGQSSDYLVLGNIVYSCVVMTVCFKAGLTLDSWNWLCHLSIWGSIAIWNAFLVLYSYCWPVGIKIAPNMAGMVELVYTTPMFWLSILLIPFIALFPDILLMTMRMTFKPSMTDKFRLAERLNASQVPSEGSSLLGRLKNNFKSKSTDRPGTAEIELHGYAFSQEESGAQPKVSRMYNTTAKVKKQSASGR